jgi:hypothetical protein
MTLLRRDAFGSCGLRREFERVQCGAGVSTCSTCDEVDQIVRKLQAEVLGSASHDDGQVIV